MHVAVLCCIQKLLGHGLRLYGEELHPLYDCPTICDVLLNEIHPYRVNFKVIERFETQYVYDSYAICDA
jgi:hypothetical protein